MSAISLGGIVFEGFEIPERVNLGGCQAGHLWKLAGGVRIFNANGPDDDPIRWEGRFRGPDAISRAASIDSMRRSGNQIPFSVLGLSYLVYIKHFEFKPQRPMEVPYEIELEVLIDQGQGAGFSLPTSLDSLIQADISAGTALAGITTVDV